jgi:hypothetical protein
MIIIATNRNPIDGGSVPFGETFNPLGPSELRFACAERLTENSAIEFDIIQEINGDTSLPPSQVLFSNLVADIRAKKRGDKWLLYIHGYNNSFLESVNSAFSLVETYRQNKKNSDLEDINVILFTWPADPGGSIPVLVEPVNSYRKIQRAAEISAVAFERLIERLGIYFVQPAVLDSSNELTKFRFNSIFHSMGSYVLENYIRSALPSHLQLIFNTLILHQSDVSLQDHPEWVDRINLAKNIYITINQWDKVLRISDVINSERLGTAQTGLNAHKPTYFDFSGSQNIGSSHNIFLGIEGNQIIRLLCHRLLVGYPYPLVGLEGSGAFAYDRKSNTWQLAHDQQ